MRQHKNKTLVSSVLFLILLLVVAFYAWPQNAAAPSKKAISNSARAEQAGQQFNKQLYPIDESNSPWLVVNKGRALPATYQPANLVVPAVPLRLGASASEMHLRQDSAAAMEQMFAAAKNGGYNLMLASGYRSYGTQAAVYQGYVNSQGQVAADTFSARPGHSEHQSGLAADIEPTSRQCELDQCFGAMPEGLWLAANAHRYGFIIRYPKSSQSLTGYQYEPWHVRFVGVGLANQLQASGQTLEQYFGLPVFTDYPDNPTELKDNS